MYQYRIYTVGLIFLLACQVENNCPEKELRFGCRIYGSECLCGYGCDRVYRYHSKEDCELALQGKLPDPCIKNPCKNNGICTQINDPPQYHCSCAGTGHYGKHCETACPQKDGDKNKAEYPIPCVEI